MTAQNFPTDRNTKRHVSQYFQLKIPFAWDRLIAKKFILELTTMLASTFLLYGIGNKGAQLLTHSNTSIVDSQSFFKVSFETINDP